MQRSLRQMIERNARQWPNKEAIVFEGRRVSYGEHHRRALQLSGALHHTGLKKRDRAAMLSMNRVEYLEWYAACELAGFLPATINFRLAAPEMDYIIRDCSPKVLFFEDQYADAIDSLREGLRKALPGLLYVCIGASPSWATDYETYLASGDAGGAPVKGEADDYAHIIYTSGTTGRPKGVVRTQQSAIAHAECTGLYSDFTFETRALVATPLFHVGGKGVAMATHLRGGTVILHRTVEPLEMLKAIETEKLTYINFVPTMVQMIVDVPGIEQYDFSSLRTINTAAAPISVPLLKRAIEIFGPIWVQAYGMTEGQVACIYRSELKPDGTEQDKKRIGSVGHAMPNVEFRVVDENDNDVPPGVPGEVISRTDSLLDHYWNNTAATLEALRNGWYHSGDMGVLDEDGYLYLVDRKKDMIISGGENIYSREVEIALEHHPDVRETAVIGIPDPHWGESVRAIVVRKPGSAVTEAALIEFTRERIARYKCPKSVVFMDELPKLASGKVNKVELRKAQTGKT